MMRRWLWLLIGMMTLCAAGSAWAMTAASNAPTRTWRVVHSYPHDPTHFTQGLTLHNGQLIESTGLYGRSGLYIKDLSSGRTLRSVPLPGAWFGEGSTVFNDQIVVLTWRQQLAQWFNLQLQPTQRAHYSGEGWGITHNGQQLITSDGSAQLRFRNPANFEVLRSINVHDGGHAVTQLNELEFIDGLIFANVWKSDRIAMIDPTSGQVCAWLDLAPLKLRMRLPPSFNAVEDVLNGIAFDPAQGLVYVTGKGWPQLFALRVDGIKAAR